MEGRRQQADGEVVVLNESSELGRIVGQEVRGSSGRMSGDEGLGLADRSAGDGHAEVRLVQKISNEGVGDEPSAENKYFLHPSVSYRRLFIHDKRATLIPPITRSAFREERLRFFGIRHAPPNLNALLRSRPRAAPSVM
jgi:hypothetical protein